MLFHPARWGVHRSADLAERGIDKHRLVKLVAAGELERIRPGVFVARPHPAEPDQRWRQLCAVALASAGPDAVLAKQAAAAALQLDGFDPPVPISVNVPTGSGRRGSGIHRRRPLDDPLVVGGLPVTSVAQTLAELGDGLTGRRMNGPAGRPGPLVWPIDLIELAVESALRRYLVDEATLQEVVHLQPLQRPGIAALRDAVERRGRGTVPTESYLETRGVQVLRAAGLPTGVRQHPVFVNTRCSMTPTGSSPGPSRRCWPDSPDPDEPDRPDLTPHGPGAPPTRSTRPDPTRAAKPGNPGQRARRAHPTRAARPTDATRAKLRRSDTAARPTDANVPRPCGRGTTAIRVTWVVGYWPVQFGERFSANAVAPSMASFEAKTEDSTVSW